MKKSKPSPGGFAVIEGLLVIVIIGIVGATGYWVLTQRTTPDSGSATTTNSASAKPGTISAIDQLTDQDSQSEASISNQYDAAEQSSAQSSNAAAANVGGAYNETNF